MNVADLSWPIARLGEGIEELARRSGLRPPSGEPIVIPAAVLESGGAELHDWIEWAGDRLGIDIDPIECKSPEVANTLRHAAPAIAVISGAEGPRFLLLAGRRFGKARVIAPDLAMRACAIEALAAAINAPHEAPLESSIDELLDVARIKSGRRAGVRAALVRERLADQRIGGLWLLRLPPTADFRAQLSREQAPARLALMLAVFAGFYVLEILGWMFIGDAALNGRVDFGWLAAWILLVSSMIPLHLLGGWIDASLAIDVGALLKLRLLLGALRLDLESVRTQGVGQMLGRVMECAALEQLAVNGGLAALVSIMELAFAIWVLAIGAGGLFHVALLALWIVVTFWLGWRYYKRLDDWTALRIGMTNDLIEQMVGHRTRLAQEWPARRDAVEDRSVKDYLASSAAMDRTILPFLAGVPNGWMLVGLTGLAPAFILGDGAPVGFAIGLGGVMLANRALSGIANGLGSAARAAIAWNQAAPLFRAGAKDVSIAPYVPRQRRDRAAGPLVDADGVAFRYDPNGDRVLENASLSIAHGDRVLLEGASGGGKSTLAALLVGLRLPESGLLLLEGLDRQTLGDSWHSIATEAPQFHENHVFTATLGFNLLMGRNWPASDLQLKEASDLCEELGLGDLLKRMPSGMMQTVGETGWQLSHGERSRVFLARALLQEAELTILDESFAALDPETLKTCLNCAFARARTLVVIAHP